VAQPKQRKRREKRIQSPPEDNQNPDVQQEQPVRAYPQVMANEISSPKNYPQQYQPYPDMNQRAPSDYHNLYQQPQYQAQPMPMPMPYQKQVLDNEIYKIRSEIQNQHAILSKQLEDIKVILFRLDS